MKKDGTKSKSGKDQQSSNSTIGDGNLRNAPRVWEGTKETYNTPVDKLEETKERVKKVQTLNVDDKKVRHI